MKRRIKFILLLLAAALMLTGCMRTVDQMYRVPKRSSLFTELQSAIDSAMSGLVYCAPVAGENQQVVQAADLNGDGTDEYLVFAREDSEYPLRILIFEKTSNSFALAKTIETSGAAFDTVEYIHMDSQPGLELVFGSQLADQLVRNVSVYTFSDTLDAKQLITAGYTKFLCADLDGNGSSELFVLKPGAGEAANGTAESYAVTEGKVKRTNELEISGSADKLKQILFGSIEGGIPAVYVTTAVADNALVTDVYIYDGETLVNIADSDESGSVAKTLYNHSVYANDIDGDGVVELPYLMPMMPMEDAATGDHRELIRWYSITDSGEDVTKTYTFHNFVDGWYMDLDSDWAALLTVVDTGDAFGFYIWDPEYTKAEMVLSVSQKLGNDRDSASPDAEDIVLFDNEDVLLTAKLEENAVQYGLTPDNIGDRFHLINRV